MKPEISAIYKVIADSLSIPLENIEPNLEYQSISEWDSLGHVKLMLDLEKQFDLTIDHNKTLELITVTDISSFILKSEQSKQSKVPQEAAYKTQNNHIVHRGLNNVYFDESKIALLDTENSHLYYRGYLINDLVEKASYEQVAYLLIFEEMPNASQLETFKKQLVSFREVNSDIQELIRILAKDQSLNDVVRTAVSSLAAPLASLSLQEQSIAYIAKIPTIIGLYYANKNHQKIPTDTNTLSQAEYLFYMLTGKKPEADVARVFETIMILQAEHGANPSTFAARVATSTQSEFGNAMTAAVATFSGMLHGGALNGVMQMLEEVANAKDVKAYIQDRLTHKKPIYGFGHRVYRLIDPRSEPLRKNAEYLSNKYKNQTWLKLLEAIQLEMKGYIAHGININDDFHACICYLLMGFTRDMLVPSFLAARSAGWAAHILEQHHHNILIRPRLKYIGSIDKKID